MKRIVSTMIAIVFFSCVAAQAQPETKMVHQLDKQTDLLLDSAAKHMINFILTKDTKEYDKSIAISQEAHTCNVRLDSLAKTAGIAYAKEIEKYVALNSLELADYHDPKIKETVANDLDKSQQISFKRKKYMVGKPTKQLFNTFIQYLPAN